MFLQNSMYNNYIYFPDENLCITTDNNKLTIKSEYIISSQVLKYAQYYKRLIHTLKPNFISKTGTEWQPIFTFSITVNKLYLFISMYLIK